MALFETTALALDSARRHAGPAGCCAFVYALRASDERTEPQDEFKAEAVVSKRACDPSFRMSVRCPLWQDSPRRFFKMSHRSYS